jgi:hypothetical protein
VHDQHGRLSVVVFLLQALQIELLLALVRTASLRLLQPLEQYNLGPLRLQGFKVCRVRLLHSLQLTNWRVRLLAVLFAVPPRLPCSAHVPHRDCSMTVGRGISPARLCRVQHVRQCPHRTMMLAAQQVEYIVLGLSLYRV